MSGGLLLRDRRATRALALQLARRLTGAELLLLTGELGSGKTTFVRYLAQALGLDPAWVSSPSFTLLQRYPPGPGGFGITHVDLYRLAPGDDVEPLGLEEALAGPDLVVVEWPEAAAALWAGTDRPTWTIRFAVDESAQRLAWVREPEGSDPLRMKDER